MFNCQTPLIMEQALFLDTPIGPLSIIASDKAVTAIRFGEKTDTPASPPTDASPLLKQVASELGEYFAGNRHSFTFPVEPAGTPFQQAVWSALQTIPCGQTRTYKQIAEQIGRPAACRAVGMANNRNPIPVVIPCHRVVGSDGKLTGYAGGLDIKDFLLRLEK